MPDYDATLTADIVALTLAFTSSTEDGDITVTANSNSVSSGDTVPAGALVRVTVTPNLGYYVAGLTYTPTGGASTPATLETASSSIFTFTMPDYNTTLTADFTSYTVGDTGPAGGYIFYVESDIGKVASQGWKYLEAAPADALSPYTDEGDSYNIDWMSLPWSESNEAQIYYSVSTSDTIGAGKENTQNMIQAIINAESEANYTQDENGAAKACEIFTLNGYGDWFLPSKNELAEMYAKLKGIGSPLGGFDNSPYWSSTAVSDTDNNKAYIIDFSSGTGIEAEKRHTYYRVRPVRAF
jgi:hypothetical protein